MVFELTNDLCLHYIVQTDAATRMALNATHNPIRISAK
jgi:hypothetical protein